MARVLTSVFTPLSGDGGEERAVLLERCRQRRLAANAAGCNYWVFERGAPSPALVEFFEAGSEAALLGAGRATDAWPDDHTILREVEL